MLAVYKKRRKKYLNWRWFMVAVLIAVIIALLAVIIWLIGEHMDLTYAVARHKAQTAEQIQSLQETVTALKTANTALITDNIALTQEVNALQIKINGQVVNVATNAPNAHFKAPSAPHTAFNGDPILNVPVAITTLITLVNGLKNLLPAF